VFDFEKSEVYTKAKELNKEISLFLRENKSLDNYIRDQLRRASISIVLNIAEGSGRLSKADKRHFYTISRGSVYEIVSLLEIIYDEDHIERVKYEYFKAQYETISKMLLGLIRSQKQ
jgi:four helix bundle protein